MSRTNNDTCPLCNNEITMTDTANYFYCMNNGCKWEMDITDTELKAMVIQQWYLRNVKSVKIKSLKR